MFDELDDFFLGGGDELTNTEPCPDCGGIINLDLDKLDNTDKYKCSHCGRIVKF